MAQAIRIGRLIGAMATEREEEVKRASKLLAKIDSGITDRERVELAVILAILNSAAEDFEENLPEKEIIDFVAGIQRVA